jgi:polysaccharide chain length determinant protein (PEP-CTERM system associated)
VLAAAVAFALYLPDLYRSSAIVLVERPLSESFVRPVVSGELESRLHVIKQEILSRDRLTELVNRFGLYPELRKKTSLEDVLTQARHDIEVVPNGPEQVSGRTKTVTFTLSYTGGERETVADVTNSIANFYVQQNDLMRSEEAIRTTQFLKAQVDESKKQLDHHEQNVRAYTASHNGELPQAVGLNLATLERLNTQLRLNGEQQLRTIEQREKLLDGLPDADVIARTASSASTVTGTATGDAPSKDWLDRMRQIETLKGELVQAEAKFTERHPDVIRIKDQIASLEREAAEQRERDAAAQRAREEQLAAAATAGTIPATGIPITQPQRRRTLDSLDADLARLKKEETDVRGSIAATEHRLDSVPGTQQEFALIQRDYQAAKDNYDQLLRKFEEAQLAENVEMDRQGERFRILEPALEPEGPAAPNRLRLMIMGLLLAFAGAAISILAVEHLDTSFHTVDELREFTTLPVLATIPRIGPAPARRRIRMALATVSALGVIVLVATLSAYIATGNEQLVRMLHRAG